MATAQPSEKVSFKDTLNLPRTDFPIRPNHKEDDAALLQRWQEENLFHVSFMHNDGKEKFILHDGPPYANGHIHLGHAYNKILKDIIGKSQRMAGKHVPITPGWDCHGLPIELKVSQEHPGLPAERLKKECRSYAAHWVAIQKEEFKKLGVLMDWDNPYLTMNPLYEAEILRAFKVFVADGYIEKKKKTVPWCPHDQTVLATAEIEYKDRKDPSVYVQFPLQAAAVNALFPDYTGKTVSILVWTTTPWTLPLNRAVLIKNKTDYAVCQHEGNLVIIAADLADKVCALAGITKHVVATVTAEQLVPYKVQHPFIPSLQVPFILDHSVSLQDGTAAVHCAPGCGPQDYDIGIRNNLEIFSPISADGLYQQGIVPEELVGMKVSDGQIWVLRKLAETGTLFFKNSITHSYPHCWRCHNGLIFRATNQWFCNLEQGNLKKRALDALATITFLPKRSINYLKATIEGRLEWCLSRQRTWGVPIPALLCTSCDYAYSSPDLIEKVARGVEREGIEYWDTVDLTTLGIDNVQCPDCCTKNFIKEKDILDVWFDSGVSHFAVLEKNLALRFPADLYLEGIDQHRGWFQSSLLTSLVLEKRPCTRAFLTHGFTVDERGQKMSKSIGNVIAPDNIIAQLGTDGLRLWASSINYEGDAVISEKLLSNVSEVYRKIRNTCRFLLSNLYDFKNDTDAIPLDQMLVLDQYALDNLFELHRTVRSAYQAADFTGVYHALADYCSVKLSSFYLDIIKDRLYVEQSDGKSRRSAQTACWYILDTLTKLMAPILSFTAEQISDHYQHNKKQSIHLQSFNTLFDVYELLSPDVQKGRSAVEQEIWIGHALGTLAYVEKENFMLERHNQWDLLLAVRDALLKSIEREREKGLIKHSLEVRITIAFMLPQDQQAIINNFIKILLAHDQTFESFLKEFLIVSQVIITTATSNLNETSLQGLYAYVEHAQGQKCPRCWQWEVSQDPDLLCKRCALLVRK